MMTTYNDNIRQQFLILIVDFLLYLNLSYILVPLLRVSGRLERGVWPEKILIDTETFGPDDDDDSCGYCGDLSQVDIPDFIQNMNPYAHPRWENN